MLALGIHYLTDYATATDTASRDRAEWPPHPARVFMALVAAHHEGCVDKPDATERAALEWLEALPPPALRVSEADMRSVVTHYVPVNDKASSPNQLNRQPRSFPKVRPHEPTVFLIWQDADATAHRSALERLCANVTRIGHSSSLVQMWVETNPPEPNLLPALGGSTGGHKDSERFILRIPVAGCLYHLEESYNGTEIEAFFDLATQIKTAKGKAQKALKDEFKERFDVPFSNSVQPPSRLPPAINTTCVYAPSAPEPASVSRSVFDENILILSKLDGPALGLEATAQLIVALRGAILKTCFPGGNAPEWLCGHKPDGARAELPHLAMLPLAFVGHEHADGHLLGLALAFPRTVPPRELVRALAPLLYADNAPAIIELKLGKLGTWTLTQETRDDELCPLALRPATWCRAATDWSSVTPVVLDKRLKSKPTDPEARFTEIVLSIAASCERAGLLPPLGIDVDKNAFLRGVPRSKPDKSGYPLFDETRFQVHVRLRFAQPVTGPVLLGAGRYQGYGLFKPITEDCPI